MDLPETRYARSPDGTSIAFQVFGSGSIDVLILPGYFTNLDEQWRIPELAETHRRIGSFARVIIMDRRGVGLSDRLSPGSLAPLETHVDDVASVLDAARASPVFVVSSESAAALALLFAATHPERVRGLVLYAPLPVDPYQEYEGVDDEQARAMESRATERWGSVAHAREDLEEFNPSIAGDAAVVERWAAYLRASGSPASVLAMFRLLDGTDARDVYPSVHVPTLLAYRPGSDRRGWFARIVPEADAALPDARVVELPGRDLSYWWDGADAFVEAVERFALGTSAGSGVQARRALTTVLFTDIVGSTERAAAIGDRAWSETLARHHRIVREAIERHRGREVDTAGDGFLATFDGPARAVRAGLQASARVTDELDLRIRGGVHTGEVELADGSPKGLAVHIGARVAGCAGPTEVWASSTVRDLTAGSGLTFEDAGEHELKGVPDRWRLYRVVDA
jgi:class 3 adenylate cyclase/alpha-beta hydrolase superfamily lysophospholipase